LVRFRTLSNDMITPILSLGSRETHIHTKASIPRCWHSSEAAHLSDLTWLAQSHL